MGWMRQEAVNRITDVSKPRNSTQILPAFPTLIKVPRKKGCKTAESTFHPYTFIERTIWNSYYELTKKNCVVYKYKRIDKGLPLFLIHIRILLEAGMK